MSDTSGPNNKKNDDKKKNNPFNDFNKFGGPGSQGNKIKNVLIWVILGISLMLVWAVMNEANNPEKEITYTQYKELLQSNAIYKATIKKSQLNDYMFHGELNQAMPIVLRDGQEHMVTQFVTNLGVLDSETEAEWTKHNVTWSYQKDESPIVNLIWTALPWVVLIGIYILFFRRMQGGGGGGGSKGIFSFGKSKAKLMNENESHVTFADVAGADEAKYELEEVVEFLQTPEKFQKLGGKIPRGLLLMGSPGTGKTLLAKAIAGEAKVPFFSISGADFVEMFVGVGASRVRDLFEQAKKNAPCLVFIDEIDAVGRQRGAGVGGGHDEREQTLNQLLVEMDGFEENNGIIIIAATNRPDVLDPALLRPGRFDRQVVVDKPDILGREGIFKVHTKKVPMGDDVDLHTLAKGTPGMSGADIANVVNEAALLAARRDAEKVTMYDFESAMDKVLMGIERKSMVLSDKEKEMTAYHEMGHALVGKFVPESYPVHKVTIIPRGRALGLTSFLPETDVHSMTKEFLDSKIIIDMGGRAAEKLVFNRMNTGAAADLEDATKIAHRMVCDWGMSDTLGPVRFAHHQDSVFLGREMSQPKDHSEHTAKLIDAEVRKILTEANATAEKILTDNMDKLHKFSKILIERETIEGEELDMLLRGEELPPINKKTLNALKTIKIKESAKEKQEDK